MWCELYTALGMGETDESKIRAALPGRQQRKTFLLALTPHGETFNTPVVVEIPYNKSSTGVLKVRPACCLFFLFYQFSQIF